MSILSFLNNLLNLFRSAATKAYNALTAEQQQQADTSVIITGIIKDNIGKGYSQVRSLIIAKTGMTPDAVDSWLQAFGLTQGWAENEVEAIYEKIGNYAISVTKNELGWQELFQTLAKAAFVYLTGGTVPLETLALGIIQIAFNKVFGK
jgi:hypothetical protein